MAEIIPNKATGVLALTISERFIANYKLENLINDPIYFNVLLTPSSSEPIWYPFRFSGINYFNNNPDEFLKLFTALLDKCGIDKKHTDNLIFLSKVHLTLQNTHSSQIGKDTFLRSNGKLLVELIEIPFTKYTMDNFHKEFDEELSDAELDDLLFMYLGVVSGMPEEYFKDDSGKLNREKITKSIECRLTERLTADKNISIKLEHPDLAFGYKYLIISSDVVIKFNSDKKLTRGAISPLTQIQNQQMMQMIVNQLLNEQAAENTELYRAILNHDFFSGSSNLSKSVGKWHRSDHLGQDLYELYILLFRYLDDENILKNSSSVRLRANFVFGYFILMGWTNHKGNFLKPTNEVSIANELQRFNTLKAEKPNYPSKTLSDIFKPYKEL